MNDSEVGTVIYIQRAQEENFPIFSGRNESPIVRHSDTPPTRRALTDHFLTTRRLDGPPS